jgi:hypothetical protein
MIDVRRIEVRSIDELIAALHPIQASAIQAGRADTALSELRLMKKNISAVLSFTAHSMQSKQETDAEFRHVAEEVRRECLLINGMISRIIFRKRWLFSISKIENARDVLAHYEEMTGAACRMCLMVSPKLGNNLLSSF